MYQCQKCGNKEKFIGYAEEKGNAFFYQDQLAEKNKISWIYIISDNKWQSKLNINRCCYCNSDLIEYVED